MNDSSPALWESGVTYVTVSGLGFRVRSLHYDHRDEVNWVLARLEKETGVCYYYDLMKQLEAGGNGCVFVARRCRATTTATSSGSSAHTGSDVVEEEEEDIGGLLGMALLDTTRLPESGRVELQWVSVQFYYRYEHIGRCLVQHVEGYARALGATHVIAPRPVQTRLFTFAGYVACPSVRSVFRTKALEKALETSRAPSLPPPPPPLLTGQGMLSSTLPSSSSSPASPSTSTLSRVRSRETARVKREGATTPTTSAADEPEGGTEDDEAAHRSKALPSSSSSSSAFSGRVGDGSLEASTASPSAPHPGSSHHDHHRTESSASLSRGGREPRGRGRPKKEQEHVNSPHSSAAADRAAPRPLESPSPTTASHNSTKEKESETAAQGGPSTTTTTTRRKKRPRSDESTSESDQRGDSNDDDKHQNQQRSKSNGQYFDYCIPDVPARFRSGEIYFRTAVTEDKKQWCALMLAACQYNMGGTSMLRLTLEAPCRIVAVRGCDEAVMGLVAMQRDGWIPFLVCHESVQHEGIGSFLLFLAMEWVRLRGGSSASLSPLNRGVMNFYRRWGFKEVDDGDRKHKPRQVWDSVMERKIDPDVYLLPDGRVLKYFVTNYDDSDEVELQSPWYYYFYAERRNNARTRTTKKGGKHQGKVEAECKPKTETSGAVDREAKGIKTEAAPSEDTGTAPSGTVMTEEEIEEEELLGLRPPRNGPRQAVPSSVSKAHPVGDAGTVNGPASPRVEGEDGDERGFSDTSLEAALCEDGVERQIHAVVAFTHQCATV